MMDRKIEKVFENWFSRISPDIHPELRGFFQKHVKEVVNDLLSGKDPERVVKNVSEDLLEMEIRKGTRPMDIIERLELLAKDLSKYKEFDNFAKSFAKFSISFLKKVIRIYEKVLSEELESKRRVERALKVLGITNQAIVKVKDENELLKEVCRIIVEEGGYSYAWIGYAEEDRSVRPVATAGKSDYAYAIKVTWDESDTGKGPTGKTIRTGKTTVVKDIERDESFKVWKENALERDFRSVIALPLHVNGEVIGALNIYSEKDMFDKEEISLLEKMADSISYSISSLRSRKRVDEMEMLYEFLVEKMGIAIVVIENEQIIFANRRAEELLGFSRNELIGKPFTILFPEEDRMKILKNYKLMLAKPDLAPNEYEMRYVDKQGKIRHAIVVISVIPGTRKVIMFVVDVTQRKDLEKKLKESEERYRAIFENSPLGVVLSSIDMKILECNDAALKMVGMRREDIIGRKWTELNILDTDSITKLMRAFYHGLSGESKELDLEIRVGGKEKYLKVFPVLLEKEANPYAFISILEDVTDKKIAEKKLKESFERIQILRSIDLGIIEGKSIRDLLSDLIKALKQKVGCDILAIKVFENGFTVSYPEIGKSLVEKIDTEKEVVVNILEKDSLSEFEFELLKEGIVRYAMIPLVVRDDKLGIIFAASRESRGNDVEFLRMIAGQLSIAMNEALLFEMKRRAYDQIEQNIEQFAILIDRIRNPLAVIQGFVETYIDDEEVRENIKKQIDGIIEIIERLESGWVESEAVREYLRRKRKNRR